MVFDDTYLSLDDSNFFKNGDWSAFYPEAAESIPRNTPVARCNPVITLCFVDADYTGYKMTRRSHTGILIFVNRAPIVFFSIYQNTVDLSTFG